MPFSFCCQRCGDQFSRKNNRAARFCSHACKASYHGTSHMDDPEKRKLAADARRGTGRGDGYVKRNGRHEHRVIAEQMLGRQLLPQEIVAHRDGVKPNNKPSNLEVFPTRAAFARALAIRRREHASD